MNLIQAVKELALVAGELEKLVLGKSETARIKRPYQKRSAVEQAVEQFKADQGAAGNGKVKRRRRRSVVAHMGDEHLRKALDQLRQAGKREVRFQEIADLVPLVKSSVHRRLAQQAAAYGVTVRKTGAGRQGRLYQIQ